MTKKYTFLTSQKLTIDIILFFFLFSFFSISVEKFDENTFKDFIRNSFEKPIFFLFYSTSCPHCNGFPEKFAKFERNTNLKNDIVVMTSDCDESHACDYFNIKGTPTTKLMMGMVVRNWIKINAYNEDNWETRIRENLQPATIKLSTNNLPADVKIPIESSLYHLIANNEDDPHLEIYRTYSRMAKVYGCPFYYSIDPKIKSVQLHNYKSLNCYKSFSGDFKAMKKFITDNSLGIIHAFDQFEYEDRLNETIVLWIFNNRFNQNIKELLLKTATEKCDNTVFGYINASADKSVIDMKKISLSSLPLLYVRNGGISCEFVWKKSIYKAATELIPNVRSNICQEYRVKHAHKENKFYLQLFSIVIIVLYIVISIIPKFKKKSDKYLV